VTLAIKDWDRVFERAQSRRVNKLSWVAIPNSLNALGFRRLMSEYKNGPEVYGVFVVLIKLASQCPKRGVLAGDAQPYTLADLALITGLPLQSLERCVPILLKIRWLTQSAHSAAGEESESAESTSSLQEKREEDITEQTTLAPNKILFDAERGEFLNVTDQQREVWRKAAPAVNLDTELAKAAAWLMANPKNLKKNYGKFITGWLSRAQDRAPRAETGSALTQAPPKSFWTELEARRLRAVERRRLIYFTYAGTRYWFKGLAGGRIMVESMGSGAEHLWLPEKMAEYAQDRYWVEEPADGAA
jgi:hypothetical protein